MLLYNIFIMGKKKGKKKVKLPIPYTESERNKKVMSIMMQINDVKMEHVITPEIRQNLNEFVKNGTEYSDTIPIPEYGRELVIYFVNNKRIESYINFRFIKVRIPDEGDENPINKLNKIQESLL